MTNGQVTGSSSGATSHCWHQEHRALLPKTILVVTAPLLRVQVYSIFCYVEPFHFALKAFS